MKHVPANLNPFGMCIHQYQNIFRKDGPAYQRGPASMVAPAIPKDADVLVGETFGFDWWICSQGVHTQL
jgi:hypothetical protein